MQFHAHARTLKKNLGVVFNTCCTRCSCGEEEKDQRAEEEGVFAVHMLQGFPYITHSVPAVKASLQSPLSNFFYKYACWPVRARHTLSVKSFYSRANTHTHINTHNSLIHVLTVQSLFSVGAGHPARCSGLSLNGPCVCREGR